MSRLVFNMTLDILNGCAYSCVDCTVDKEYPIPSVPLDDIEQLTLLAKQMREEYDAELFELTVGPTDFITSEIGLGILDHPLVINLLKEFDAINIALSMLSDRGLVELAKGLDRIAPNKRLRVSIPVTIKNIYNEKYVDALKRRIGILRDNMVKCDFYRVYTTVPMMGHSLEVFSPEVVEHVSTLRLGGDQDGVWQTPEWIFGHSRARFDDILTHQAFVRDYRTWCDKMSDMKDSDFYSGIVPYPQDGVEVTYRDGKLYYLPYVVEKFHWWHPHLEISKPWTADAVLEKKDNIIMDNMMDEEHSRDCEGCLHRPNCDQGDVKTLMRMLGERRCLPGIAHREDLAIDTRPDEVNRRELFGNG